MVRISIESRNLDRLLRSNDAIKKSITEINQQFLLDIGKQVIDEALINLGRNKSVQSGELADSIKILEEGKGFVVVGTDADHAAYIEFGRGPVFPISAKVLHWIDPETGEDVFAKEAKATEPRPFMAPAIEKVTKKFRDLYLENMEHEIRFLVK